MLLMQSLNKLGTPEQKLDALIKKHAELVSDNAEIYTLHLPPLRYSLLVRAKGNVVLYIYCT